MPAFQDIDEIVGWHACQHTDALRSRAISMWIRKHLRTRPWCVSFLLFRGTGSCRLPPGEPVRDGKSF